MPLLMRIYLSVQDRKKKQKQYSRHLIFQKHWGSSDDKGKTPSLGQRIIGEVKVPTVDMGYIHVL